MLSKIPLLIILAVFSGCILFNIAAAGPFQPPKIKFEHPLKTGLSTHSITQDKDGFLWIGTSGGVLRYDGYELKHYVAGKNTLSTNYTPDVFVDSEGLIWIGTDGGGLNMYDKTNNRFSVYKNDADDPETISSDNFNWKPGMIAEDKEGFLWFGTQNGLNCFNKKTRKFKRFFNDPNNPYSLSDNYIRAVFVDRDDIIWIGTKKEGLNSYDKKTEKFKHYKKNDDEYSLSDDEVLGITEDHQGKLWIGTKEGGLNCLDKSTGIFTHYWHDPANPFSLGNDEVSHITEDRLGDLWLSRTYSTAGGVEKFERKTGHFIRYKNHPEKPESISGNIIVQSFEDSSGIMWFVENTGVINKYDCNTRFFNTYRHNPENPKSISTNTITTIMEDSDGDVWFGTFLGGINRFDKKSETFISYSNDPEDIDSFLHNYAFSVFEDSDNQFWVGTDDGILNLFAKRTGKIIRRYQNPFSSQVARSLTEDKADKKLLWFGTETDGLFKFNKKTGLFKQYRHDPENPGSLSSNGMFFLFQSPDNVLWITTFGGGLNKYNRKTDSFKSYKHKPDDPFSISSNIVNDCHIDKNGIFWVGTDTGGLNEFNPETGRFIHYGANNGFPTNSIKGIVEDNSGKLWIGSDSGILKFNPETKNVEKIYTKSDGLPGNNISMYATSAYKTRDGRIWFATGTDGVVSFFPDQIKDNLFIPPIVLTSFKQGHNQIDFQSAVEKVTRIELSWLYNFFEFEFSALSYTLPEKNQFKYMLEGFDKDWYNSGTRRFGRYSGLPDGHYTLRIIGSNNDGVWNNQGVSIKISVTPPVWRSWWAYFIYTSTIAGLIVFLIIYQRKKLEHEKLVNARLRTVDKLKDEIFATTSHELKTPLNGIIGLTEALIDGVAGKLNDKIKNNLLMISLSGRRLSNLVNDLLDYSRLRHKDIRLQSQVIDIKILADVVITISQSLILGKEILLLNKISDSSVFAYADENRVQQILYNLVGNAIKFTEKGTIIITAAEKNDKISISVSDTGIGISQKNQATIFDSFEQVDSSVSREYGGTGLGLAISKKLVELHGGGIGLFSEKGVGSKFYFTLPKAKDSFIAKTASIPGKHLALSQMAPIDKPIYNNSRDENNELKNKKILIVDDEPVNLQVIDNYLYSENFYLVKISDGAAALSEIDKAEKVNRPFDLILLDVMMPVISGYDICRKIREKYTADILPIIMLTAKNTVSDLVTGLNAGANDYLAKPFQKEELLARIKAQLPLKELVMEREKARDQLRELNISLEKKVEERTEQLAIANKELKESIEMLKSTHNHLVQTEKMAALGSLVAGVAHEISTPVGVCVTASSFLEMKTKKIMSEFHADTVKKDAIIKYFNSASEASSIIMGNLNRAADLILGFKKISVDQTSDEKRRFNLRVYIHDIISSLRPRYKRIQPAIKLDCPDNLDVVSYPGAFAQIFTNLIVNSLIHGFEEQRTGNEKINIGVKTENKKIRMIYSDNGKGMDATVIKQIFDPFFTTKRGLEGGTGLGMHIVFNIITQKLSGTIHCDSSPGNGVIFTISIPDNPE